MSAQHSAAIQTLLDAEKDATKIIDQSREYRTKRMKQARDEARREIEEYRQKMENRYRAFEAEHTDGNTAAEQEAFKDAEAQIKQLQDSGKKNKEKVIEQLLASVFEAEPKPLDEQEYDE